jgi:hypothetical protein
LCDGVPRPFVGRLIAIATSADELRRAYRGRNASASPDLTDESSTLCPGVIRRQATIPLIRMRRSAPRSRSISMVSSVRHRPEGVRCERPLPGISFLYKWLCRLASFHGSIGSGWRNMPQTLLLPAMPPPGKAVVGEQARAVRSGCDRAPCSGAARRCDPNRARSSATWAYILLTGRVSKNCRERQQ